MANVTENITTKSKRKKFLSFLAGGAAAALVGGSLVVAGITADPAVAAPPPPPTVEVTHPDSYIAGEDLTLNLTFTGSENAGSQYNLSAGLVLPVGAKLVDPGTLGTPKAYAAVDSLPGANLPGETCEELGLLTSGSDCIVPEGSQYLVFQNISDIPEGASTSHSIVVRPNAGVYNVGDDFPYQLNAYTSSNPRYIPVFPGSTGVNNEAAKEATSLPGIVDTELPVNALRIEKSEPSPENELLRGVHQNATTYTLRVWHTGEGDITGVKVTDYLPAGLEYLGLGNVDNTTNANGTPGAEEYADSGDITEPGGPAGGPGRWGATDADNNPVEESVTTVQIGAAEAESLGLPGAGVYTKVVWDLGTLLATTDIDDIERGTAQVWDATPGKPGYFDIRYLAAIPLYENTMEFGEDSNGSSIANLDNNNGASTRHIGEATTYTNVAEASGLYGSQEVSDRDSEVVDAVDVRILKSVDVGEEGFVQGDNARYTLNIATSEYMSAALSSPGDTIIDELGDGLCPVFPSGTTGANGPTELLIEGVDGSFTPETWSTAITDTYSADAECAFPSPEISDSGTSDSLVGAYLQSITFNPNTGRFSMEFSLNPANVLVAGLSEGHEISYSVAQNDRYVGNGGANGATTSADVFTNDVEITATTTPITPVSGGPEQALDDSEAEFQAKLSDLQKHVLHRDEGVPSRDEVAKETNWVTTADANVPFQVGDEVWYRIQIEAPTGADVRNPKFTDFLPQGVSFAQVHLDPGQRHPDTWIDVTGYGESPEDLPWIGTCGPTSDNLVLDWIDKYVSNPTVEGSAITFELGSKECFGTAPTGSNPDNRDRFMPLDATLVIYLKVTVTDPAAFAAVDMPQNLAKYQQENVNGDVFFLRDAAEIEVDRTPRLLKGIESINEDIVGGEFNSNIDGREVRQGDEVTFRLDVTAPYATTSGYVVYDVLPEGITSEHVDTSAYTAALHNEIGEPIYTVNIIDADAGTSYAELGLRSDLDGRSVIVWRISSDIPASTKGTETDPAVERGVTLGYTITVPDGAGNAGALLGQEYVNNASITEFTALNNGGEMSTMLVTGGDSVVEPRTPADANEFTFPDVANDMSDPSDISLPGIIGVSKELVSTEMGDPGADSTDGVIVHGEFATFEYSVTLPANTTVREGILFDRGSFDRDNGSAFPYRVHSAALPSGVGNNPPSYDTVTGDTTPDASASFQFNTDTGELVFPEFYQVGDTDETFTVRLVVWTNDLDATNTQTSATRPDIADNTVLENTAEFIAKNYGDNEHSSHGSNEAEVTFREPELVIEKSADPREDVALGNTITYRLEISNDQPVASYDNTVVDTVPSGLRIDIDSFEIGGVEIDAEDLVFHGADDNVIDTSALTDDDREDIFAGSGGTVTWNFSTVAADPLNALAEIIAGNTVVLTYEATLDPAAGAGREYENTAEVEGFTLPSTLTNDPESRRGDRISNDTETITATTATLTKGVRVIGETAYGESASAPIGETVEYEVVVTLHPGVNYYNATIIDEFTGSNIGTPERVNVSQTPSIAPAGSVPGTWTYSDGQWTLAHDGERHILSSTERRTLTFTYEVVLENDMTANSLGNTATFEWTPTADSTEPEEVEDDATVNVLNPTLGIAKKVDGKDSETYNPDATFEYTLQVTNSGATDAYHVTIVDEVPTNVVVDPATISSVQGVAGVLTDQTATGGGTITWANIPGPLAVYTNGTDSAETIDLSYSAKFVDSAGLTRDTRTNTANVTHFESFEDGGRNYDPPLEGSGSIRDTAEVRPIFPYVELDKAVSEPVDGEEYGVVNVGESLNWTLTLTNTGEGTAQTIVATDELPENWEYVADSARVKIGNNPIALIEPEEDGQTLTWNLGTDTGPGVLPGTIEAPGVSGLPSRTITITFDARPLDGALDDAGTGIEIHAHVNTLSAVTTDTTGYEDEDYTGPGDDATAYIPEADLVMDKTTVPTAAVPAGTPNVHAWNLVVTNEGPDTAEGPITVTDTTSALPAGITVTRASGEGWTCDVPNRAADGTTTFECARDADESLASGESFPTIEVWVNIASDQLATTVRNTATVVPGKTFDPEDDNNEDDDELTTSTEADLAIAKNISGPVAPDVVTAGGPITWEITAQNIGPSDSLSTTDNPITITDTVPVGVQNVSATANASWSVAASNGFPAQTGDVITWTYLGDRITPGAFASSVSLAGTVLPSQTDAITNAAVVHPGVTPDPNYVEDPSDSDYPEQNNYDEVTTTTPVVAATLSIDKVRVVPDGSGGFRLADPQNRNDDIVAGDSVFYQITVTNNGPSDAIGVEVVDETPAGLTYADHVNVVGTWQHADGGITSAFPEGAKDGRIFGTFTLQSDQAPGEDNATRFIVEYDTIETLDPVEVVHNWAEVTSDNWDPNDPGDPWDRDDDRSNSSRIVDLGVTKSHTGSGPFTPGTAVEYTIEVTNNGPSATPGPLTIEDSLPAGMAYVAGSASITMPTGLVAPLETEPALRGTENRVLEWVLVGANELFASDTQITITYDAMIHENVREAVELENIVTVDGEEPDGDPTNNRDTDKITTGPTSATMGLVKEVQANDGSWLPITAKTAGTSATWRVTITNEGPSAAPVTFTDEMPVGITLTGISGTGWDCDVNEASCEYTANNGLHPVGSSVITMTSDIDAQVPPTPAPGLVNWGEITWTDGSSDDPTEKTARDDAAVTTERVADLGIVKQALNPADGDIATEVVAGEELWYTLELTNHGPSAAVGPLVVNDMFPEGVNFVRLTGSSASTWDVSVDSDAPRDVTFSRSDATVGLAVGESTTIRILASVDPDVVADTELVNTATIDESTLVPNNDPNEDNDRDEAKVDTVRESHLTVDKGHIAAEPIDEFAVGKDVTFTISVTNEGGPSNASGIVVTDTLPAGLAYDSMAGDGWVRDSTTENSDGTTTVVASYAGEVAPGASTTELQLIATVTAAIGDGPEVTNDVCITGVGTGQTNTNEEACDDDTITVVPLADLFVQKTVAEDSVVSAGTPITWNITVGNAGPSDSVSSADNRITVTDRIPVGIHSVANPSITDPAGDWTALLNGETWTGTATAGDTITWVFQGERIPAASTEFVLLQLTGTIDAAWIDGEEIVNTATVTPGETKDPVAPNNEDDSTVTPGNDTSLRITKTRVVDVDGEWVTAPDEESFNAGEDITYRITVINDGPAVARDVQVVDETPEGLVYEGFADEVGEWSAAPGGSSTEGDDPSWVTFTLAETQPVGADNYRSFIVTFSSDPALGDPTDVQNWAEVTAENWPDGSDRDDDTALSKRSADLSIAKSHSVPAAGEAVVAGETVSYELVVTNEGSSISDAPIVVTDTLPEGFSYIEGSGSIEPVVDGQVLTWDDITAGETLERGATVTITYEVLVDSSLVPAEGVRNVAVVDGPNDENPLNDRDDDLVNITGVADLALDKVAVTAEDEITAGESVTWSITPRNEGPSVSLSSEDNPITVTDVIPDGISALVNDPSNADWQATTSNAGGWSQATAGDTITWTFLGDRIQVGDAPAIEVTGLIDPAWIGGDEITNVAQVNPGDTPEPPESEDPTPNDDTSTIVPGDRTVIDIAKNRVVLVEGEWVHAASLDPVPTLTPGETVSYRIDVVNEGPAIARNVTVIDPIPVGLSDPRIVLLDGFGEWTGDTATCEHGVTDLAGYPAEACLTASLTGPLGLGVSEARSFIVTFDTDPALNVEEELVNWAQARAENVPEDERPEDDDSTENRAISDLSIVKTAVQELVLAGSTVDYELVVTNEGPSIARGPITITDQLPLGMGYVAETTLVSVASADPVAIEPTVEESQGSELLTWTLLEDGHLDPGATIVVTLQSVTAADRIAPDGLTNVATVAADDDTNPLNNESNATVIVDPVVTLIVEKTASEAFQVGSTGTYEITVTNAGPTVDPGPITVTDELPAGLTFESSDDDTVQVDGDTVTWTVEEGLQIGETHRIELVVNVGEAAYPEVTNIVTVDSPAEKTPESILEDDVTVPVKAAPPIPETGGTLGLTFILAGLLLLAGTGAIVLGNRRREATQVDA